MQPMECVSRRPCSGFEDRRLSFARRTGLLHAIARDRPPDHAFTTRSALNDIVLRTRVPHISNAASWEALAVYPSIQINTH